MPHKQNSTWVVVADNCQAKIYRLVKFPKIEEISHLEHPESRLHNQDLVSSKPGRGFQSRGSGRYSYQSEVEPKELEAIKFATDVAHFLEQAEKKGDFHRLYILAEPSFLGVLRQHLSQQIKKTIVGELAIELVTCDVAAIEKHLAQL